MTTTSIGSRVPLALAAAMLYLSMGALMGGCEGVLVGNVFVLIVTVGIFFGTLGLGRSTTSGSSATASRSAERSATQQPRS